MRKPGCERKHNQATYGNWKVFCVTAVEQVREEATGRWLELSAPNCMQPCLSVSVGEGGAGRYRTRTDWHFRTG